MNRRGTGWFVRPALSESTESNPARQRRLSLVANVFDDCDMAPKDQKLRGNRGPQAVDRRAAARLPQDALLQCSLGQICDLSRTGMRVRTRRLPDASLVYMQLSDGQNSLRLKAEVVWVNKLGFRKYEVGLQFLSLSTQELATVSRMAMYNRYNRTM
jgi:hypothetical protein